MDELRCLFVKSISVELSAAGRRSPRSTQQKDRLPFRRILMHNLRHRMLTSPRSRTLSIGGRMCTGSTDVLHKARTNMKVFPSQLGSLLRGERVCTFAFLPHRVPHLRQEGHGAPLLKWQSNVFIGPAWALKLFGPIWYLYTRPQGKEDARTPVDPALRAASSAGGP